MQPVLLVVLVLVIAAVGVMLAVRQARSHRRAELADAQAEARRWLERLGGQVYQLHGDGDAAEQAITDAPERYTAAGAQMDQAGSLAQCRLVTQNRVGRALLRPRRPHRPGP